MEFLSPIIGPIVESLMGPIRKHAGFLISSTKNVRNMDAKMKELNRTSEEVQSMLVRADENTEVVPERVEPWLEAVKDLNGRSNLIKDFGCFNVFKRYKVGKQSYSMLQEINDLEDKRSKIVFTHAQKPLAEVFSSSTAGASSSAPLPIGSQNNFGSRDMIFNKALQFLKSSDDTQKMIALCGMGGVGKTTMMEELKKAVESSKVFNRIVKVVIGENADTVSIQKVIAERISLEDLPDTTKDARADRLLERFQRMSQGQNKVLVILDDLWNEVDLKDVGLSPLPNGIKLLFTSREEFVCIRMGVNTDSILKVGVLSKIEAESLFFKIVELSPPDVDDVELRRIGERIVKKCGGLPIAIVTIGKHLKGNIKEAWLEALSNLQHNKPDVNVNKIFEISYNNLKREDDKAIFILSGLFPDDFNIPIEDLVMYGWGLKLFTEVHNLAEARRRIITCVNNLLRANLLVGGDYTRCVKMHDLVRTFVLSNFSKIKQASLVNHDSISRLGLTKDVDNCYERILFKCTNISEFPLAITKHDNLSLLIVMGENKPFKFQEDLYRRMEKLEVVSYEKMSIPLLPLAFEYSTKLRTLCLRSCLLINDDICFLGSLRNLETLSFAGCVVSRLPSEIGKLEKLRLLDVTGCVDLCIDDGVFQNLCSLEELYMRASEYRPARLTCANYEELEKLSPRLFSLELEFFERKVQIKNILFNNLQRFRISVGCQLEELKDDERYSFTNTIKFVGDYNELQECKIIGDDSERQECNIIDLFHRTEELSLEVVEMNYLTDVLLHHSFPNLRVLHVTKCVDLKCLFTVALTSGLMNLERLTISQCPVLTSLVGENNGTEVIRFPKLNFMSLEGLPKIASIFDNVVELPELVTLELIDLPNFVSIFHDNNKLETKTLFNKKVVIPKLEKLYISKMENLKQIWPAKISTADDNTTLMLREVRVSNCDSLTNLFPSKPLPLLNNLEVVEVRECGSIEVLFNMDVESVREMGEYTSSRLKNINVGYSHKLKELWRIRCEDNSVIKSFKNVESIWIEGCKGFTNLFTPTTIKFDLGALTFYGTNSSGKEIDSVSEGGEISEVGDYIPPNLTYPSYFLHATPRLQRLRLDDDDKRVDQKVVFEMDSELPLLLPCLEYLRLKGLKETSHVWKCNNWSKFLHQQFPFQNLTRIYLGSCHKIKYLFSPLMAIHLSNLKGVEIGSCNGIEEVVSSRDEENTSISASSHQQNATFFPRLEHVSLTGLPRLKSIDTGDKFSNNFTDTTIHDQFQSGQTIGACLSFLQYPTMLQELEIYKCERVMEVFMFSTLESLNQLKVLKVVKCEAMQVVVKEEESETSSKVVVFPRLETLELDGLPNLRAFFLGKNEFRWPLLDYVKINDCPQMGTFTAGHSKTPKLKHIQSTFGKYSLECGLNFPGTTNQNTLVSSTSSSNDTLPKGMTWSSFHNLIECHISFSRLGRSSIIPSNALLQLQKLEKINIYGCNGVEEVFEVALDGSSSREVQTVLQIPKLKQVKIRLLYDLKYLWKSNKWMVLEFPCLTTVTIFNCNRLEHVFTCSMVGSLLQLQHLQITWCKNIEVIVKMGEEEEADAKVNENIILPCLKSLELCNLQSLKGFCLGKKSFSFAALETLHIKNCPAITEFTNGHLSTPILQVIDTCFGMHRVTEGLNSFIKTKQQEGHKL